MVLVSLLLIVGSGGLLATGILLGNDGLVLGSIALSLGSAVTLFLGIRAQRAAPPVGASVNRMDSPTVVFSAHPGGVPANEPLLMQSGPGLAVPAPPVPPVPADDDTRQLPRIDDQTSVDKPAEEAPEQTAAEITAPADSADSAEDRMEDSIDSPATTVAVTADYDDPPGEPKAELLLSSEEKRLSQMSHEVLVVDGRPRYHVAGCSHLADKASQSLPAAEATELGFTPCSLCSAATTLLISAT